MNDNIEKGDSEVFIMRGENDNSEVQEEVFKFSENTAHHNTGPQKLTLAKNNA